jgi:hypothetical protein
MRLAEDISRSSEARLMLFRNYLERHIRIDRERHGPMSAQLLESLCGRDDGALQEGHRGARDALLALVARRVFWS